MRCMSFFLYCAFNSENAVDRCRVLFQKYTAPIEKTRGGVI